MDFRGAIGVALAGVLLAEAHAADFTDSAHRTVHLPEHIARVIPAGPPADVLLYSLAPEAMAGLVEPWRPEQKPFVIETARALAGVPRITGKLADTDVATLKGLHADLIVDYGDVDPRYAGLADKVQAATGVPYILLDGRLAQVPMVVRELGAILNDRQRAEQLAAFAEETLARLAPVAALPADLRVPLYYARGKDGLQAVRSGSSLDEAMALAGARNVVPAGKGAFVTLSVAEVAALHPKIVVLADPSAAASDSSLRKALPAETRFLVDKGLPYPFVERPPSLNRLLGALWLGAELHPDTLHFGAAEAAKAVGLLFHVAPPAASLGFLD